MEQYSLQILVPEAKGTGIKHILITLVPSKPFCIGLASLFPAVLKAQSFKPGMYEHSLVRFACILHACRVDGRESIGASCVYMISPSLLLYKIARGRACSST